jgi:hypothetical protein
MPVVVFKATEQEVRDLAAKGRAELIHQAARVLSAPKEVFDGIAWRIAASILKSELSDPQSIDADRARDVLPYLCFLAEQLSPDWEDRETRDVFLRPDGDVCIHAVADLRAYVKTLSGASTSIDSFPRPP